MHRCNGEASEPSFFTHHKGEFEVKVTAEFPYETTTKQSVTISLPAATKCKLQAILPRSDVTVAVPQAIRMKQTVDKGQTVVDAIIAHHSEPLKIRWMRETKEPVQNLPLGDATTQRPAAVPSIPVPAKPVVKEVLKTCEQDYLHSIGGGICTTTLYQKYTITNGSVSVFELEIDGDHGTAPGVTDYVEVCKKSTALRVLNVDGPGLRKWDVVEHSKGGRLRVLKLEMESSVEASINFVITAELEMCGTSAVISLPRFTPLNVNRTKGNLSIQARTAVEIQEVKVSRLAKVDVSELPAKLRTTRSILHAYKFLVPEYTVVHQVTKHDDVDVLAATAEAGCYVITHTGEHLFYHVMLHIRNTQSQFVRIRVPEDAEIWSAQLQRVAVKPALSSAGYILLPLKIGSPDVFIAELMFVKKHALPAKLSAQPLAIEMPVVDIPVNHLFVQLWFPSTNHYSAWEGDLDEVHCWSDSCNWALNESTGPSHSSCMNGTDDWNMDADAAEPSSGDVSAGIRPLTFKTTPLRTGRSFHLEKMLVTNGKKISLSCMTAFSDKEKLRKVKPAGWWF
ncbi:hypothetical protein DIPPA_06595 [Diplonema papillatum]|nr:hypothetical protein DIPPA_06595 [Diplonema papillatum]